MTIPTTKIAESELILNPDGSVYHLHLRPEHLCDTIITVGDPDRVGEVSKYFDHIEARQQKREFVTHVGRIGQQRLMVISTGIGTDNIDIVFNELDALANIDFASRTLRPEPRKLRFVRIGTSGCMRPEIPLDSFLLSEYAVGMDGLLFFYDAPENAASAQLHQALDAFLSAESAAMPLPFYTAAASPSLAARFRESGVYTGITLTATGFYAPQNRELRLKSRMAGMFELLERFHYQNGTHITNFEMETAAIYALAAGLGHEAVSLSTLVANRRLGTFSSDPYASVDRLIRWSLERLLA